MLFCYYFDKEIHGFEFFRYINIYIYSFRTKQNYCNPHKWFREKHGGNKHESSHFTEISLLTWDQGGSQLKLRLTNSN